ncbi:hypothetical protein BS50DRAFT_670850 [Corynespora cassiicola Philippines]|uniref:Zn(2)-C6 fungal-type domain-containing protein n=1 Tax=Corynespora cassiicola Philippines TaxID=1448308 RepID=A0A2T2P9Y1_CORCC|nr:hypothetical protein BS50DRAFT_670850 [Corynespora cassiicola Philippines]
MPRKKQGLRSYHHKSRNGCSNCKRRRVKCSMQTPACNNCVRRNEVCEYLGLQDLNAPKMAVDTQKTVWSADSGYQISSLDPRLAAISYTLPSHSVPYASPLTWTIESNTPSFSNLRPSLSLLLGNSWFSQQEIALWAPVLEFESAKYPYLRHSIISLSCLIHDLTQPSSDGSSLSAVQHSIAATTLFRQSQIAVDEYNWLAVISFGVMFIIFQCATQQACPDSEFDIIGTLRVFRGSVAVEATTKPYLRRSRFWPLIQARNRALAQHQDNTNLGSNLDTLEKVIQIALEEVHEDNDAEERAEINRHAFYALKGWLRDCNGNPQTWVQSCLWPSLIRPEYLDLFAENDDVALLIFIHWCAIMYRSRKRWFFTSWSKRAALKAIQNLSEDWGELLTWPLETLSVVPDIPLEIQTWHKVVPYRSAGAPNTTASAY